MFLLSKLWGYLAGAGALVIAILAALGMAKRAGKKEEQADETAKSLQQAKESNVIDQSVHNLSQSDLDKRLRVDQRD
jgi:hypothetical protein